MWAKDIKKNRVFNGLFHVADILPTLAEAAGLNFTVDAANLDGISHWMSLQLGASKSKRTGLLYNIDPQYYAIQENGYKLINGSTIDGIYDIHLGNFVFNSKHATPKERFRGISTSSTQLAFQRYETVKGYQDFLKFYKEARVICGPVDRSLKSCNPLEEACLYNLEKDPCEYNNLAETNEGKQIVEYLEKRIGDYRRVSQPPRNKPFDPRSNPRLYNNSWTHWIDVYPKLDEFSPLFIDSIKL